MKFSSIIFTISIFLSSHVFAQSKAPTQPELESGTIESQFTYIIEKSSSFKDFQLIRKSSILKVKSNALDSLKSLRKEISSHSSETKQLNQKIVSLEKEVKALTSEVDGLKEDKDSISLFGNNVEKSLYNTILISCIVVLLILLVFFVLRFKANISSSKKIKREFEVLEKEYEEHRKKSLKKEQEIMRKLQDEINKNNP